MRNRLALRPMTIALPAPPPLASIASPSLFLDFDGTLVELAPTPDAIAVPSDLARRLEALANRHDQRIAVVSGRFLADIDRHLGNAELVMIGSHGAEIRERNQMDGQNRNLSLPPSAHQAADDFAARTEGILIERKPLGIGIHYRARPDLADVVEDFTARLSKEHGLHRKRGKMVVELTTCPADKGTAVRELMARTPFRNGTPVFIGDDVTDEDGFRVVAALGGFGILVGEKRATAARYRLGDVAEVHAWLNL
ncbi:MAG: trehalose-phosphatase [Pacificimonas sp.]